MVLAALLLGQIDAQAAHLRHLTEQVRDSVVRDGFSAAVNSNLLPAATEKVYPGHFTINADGGGYGNDTTWPGLDSWQMAGAYLLIGKKQTAIDYFDFVCASQRKDGNIPFAIFSGDTKNDGAFLRGMKWPDDVFEYKPPVRPSAPPGSQVTKKWFGLFTHWELKSNPLSVLGPICHLLTAAEIFDATKDKKWLRSRIGSIDEAGAYLMSQVSSSGLLSGSGFYTERPPRDGWDGMTQCYGAFAFKRLAKMHAALGDSRSAAAWQTAGSRLASSFRQKFWVRDHFAEYIHRERGLVDAHGLTDTNWAAVGLGVATDKQAKTVWPKLVGDKGWWPGGMPTITATKPKTYEDWEHEVVPFSGTPPYTNDVAAMGRTWYVEALACKRMGADRRLLESARAVARMAKGGFWRERYHAVPAGVEPFGTEKYCEYPAVFVRVVLENTRVFMSRR
ncbi:MAG: hypothetical protein JSS65_13775 [Armatimonadetes bacterium]|nr:hypothetical protein [Armatimonadota bacterium]